LRLFVHREIVGRAGADERGIIHTVLKETSPKQLRRP
jgi:hypothetical protein